MNRFAAYAWAVVAYNVLVILWGALVRATGSGAGCGEHWPLCNGQVVPVAHEIETVIEFIHRVTSAVGFVMVAALSVWSRRAFAAGHPARRAAAWSFGFMVVESLVGAFIVVRALTGDDSSVARAVVIAAHQTNTLLLLGALALTAWWAQREPAPAARRAALTAALGAGLLGMLLLGSSGAITALGDTLFKPASLADGLRQKLEPGAHFLVQLRALHPIVAAAMGAYVTALGWLVGRSVADGRARRYAVALTALFFAQGGVGLLNLALLAPVAMQLAHLLMADLVWIAFVMLGAQVLTGARQVQSPARPASPVPPAAASAAFPAR